MVLGSEEADIPQDIHREHYVHAAFIPDVISLLFCFGDSGENE